MSDDNFLAQQISDLEYYNISLADYTDIVSQLPDKKYYEYIYHKFFNPEARFETWRHWEIWNYPVQDALRYKYILLDNVTSIKNCSVADFGCHIGYMSMFMSHLGAKNITGTNVRERELDLSKELCAVAGINNVEFVYNDLHNYNNLKTICNSHETILLSGVLYHLTDQLPILETITNSSARTVIIDNLEDISIKDKLQPLIAYKIENTDNSVNGFIGKSASMIVGNPNQSWIDFTMTYLGWEKVRGKDYEMIHQRGRFRNVSTWTRDI